MAKKESTVSKAEQYRKERKARIAKSAKKSAKKNASGNSGSDVLIARIVAVVFAVAVVVGISFLLLNNFGVFERIVPVYSVGDVSISEAEYTYQLRSTYNQYCTMSEQYMQYYGSNILGFDTTKSPDEQKYTADDKAEGEDANKYDTWMDYFADISIIGIQERKALVAEAEKAGIKLDDADLKEIDDQINELEASVVQSSTSTNPTSLKGYLKNVYGNGMTLKLFKELQKETALASKYQETKQKEFYDSYSADEIKGIYEKDKATYDVVDYRAYTIAFEKEKKENSKALTKDQAKKRADDMIYKITDEASFNKLADGYAKADDKKSTTYADKDATLTKGATGSNFDSMDKDGNIKKWVYAADRKVGDKKVFELESSYFVIYIVTAPHEIYAYNSRHILVQFEAEKEGDKATDKDWDALKKEAEKIRDEWTKGDKTEDSFAALAEKYSDDGGSNTNGGLYENTAPGQFVTEYENWCLDSARKEGDVGIVKVDASNYQGYHIIYFKSVNDLPVWNDTIRSEKSSEAYSEYHEDLLAKAEYKYVLNNKRVDACVADTLSYIELVVAQNAASSQYSF